MVPLLWIDPEVSKWVLDFVGTTLLDADYIWVVHVCIAYPSSSKSLIITAVNLRGVALFLALEEWLRWRKVIVTHQT